MSDLELRNYFNFGEADLYANRAGRLTKEQETRLLEVERGASQIFRWVGIFLLLIAIFVTLFLLNEARKVNWADLIGLSPALCIVWLMCGGFAYGSFKLAGSKNDNSVQKAEGEVNFVKVESRESYKTASGSTSYRTVQKYELRVDKVKFQDVNEELLNLIREGDVYAFYYAKDSKQILSCEFISKGK